MRTRSVIRLAFLPLMLVLLVACGGGDDSDEASRDSPNTAPASGQTGTTRPVDTSFSGAGSGRFCEFVRSYVEKSRQVQASGGSPESLRTLYGDIERGAKSAVDLAPGEIKPDMTTVANTVTSLRTALERVNYEAGRLPPDALAATATPEFQAAVTRVEAYARNVCGARF